MAHSRHAMLMAAAIEWLWSALTRPLPTLLAQMSVVPLPFSCRSNISVSFWSGGVFAGWEALTTESSLMSGCGQGHEPPEIDSRSFGLSFQC